MASMASMQPQALLLALTVLVAVALPPACSGQGLPPAGTVTGVASLFGKANYWTEPGSPIGSPPYGNFNGGGPPTATVPFGFGDNTFGSTIGSFGTVITKINAPSALITVDLQSLVLANWGLTPSPTITLTSSSWVAFDPVVFLASNCAGVGAAQVVKVANSPLVTITFPQFPGVNCQIQFRLTDPICFPASSTMHRLMAGTDDTWETVPIPELRLGDTVECLAREPAFGADGVVSSAPHDGRLARCMVYDYKKAAPGAKAHYTRITYEAAGDQPAVSMSANHHLLDPVTGQARQAGSLRAGDLVLRATKPGGAAVLAKVLSVDTVEDAGAYAPLLSGGGLPIVDGVVAYPSSGESDVGLDAKHWGQYYLHAPVWQASSLAVDKEAPKLSQLGAQQPVGPFTQKWHALGATAAREGRSFCDWAGVAKDMHAAVAQGKRFTEAEALGVLNRHLKPAAPGVSDE